MKSKTPKTDKFIKEQTGKAWVYPLLEEEMKRIEKSEGKRKKLKPEP